MKSRIVTTPALRSSLRRLTTMSKTAPRRFAPLKDTSGQQETANLPKLQGIIFDVDGTLCLPQNYMFTQMRTILSIPKTTDILTHIASLPTPESRSEAMAAISAIEREAMSSQSPQPGLLELMQYLQSRGVRKGICTRNFDQPVTHLLTKFLAGVDFAPIVTRSFTPPKPEPAGLLFIARAWGLVRDAASASDSDANDTADSNANVNDEGNGNGLKDPPRPRTSDLLEATSNGPKPLSTGAVGPARDGTTSTISGEKEVEKDAEKEEEEEVGDASHLIMVGDSLDDMTAGRRAGAATVLLVNGENARLAEHPHTDLVIGRLDELIGVLEDGFVGREIPTTTSTSTSTDH